MRCQQSARRPEQEPPFRENWTARNGASYFVPTIAQTMMGKPARRAWVPCSRAPGPLRMETRFLSWENLRRGITCCWAATSRIDG
jgi:hypothetical protein